MTRFMSGVRIVMTTGLSGIRLRRAAALRAKLWHDRAEEVWSMASQMPDPEAKSTLVEIAERYDALADSIAAKQAALHRRESRQTGSKDPVASDAPL